MKKQFCKILYVFLLASLLPACVHTAPAHDYPPGTVGWLAEDCRAAMQRKAPADFFASECSEFTMLYAQGAFLPSMFRHGSRIGYKAVDESCQEEVNNEWKRYKEKMFCRDSCVFVRNIY